MVAFGAVVVAPVGTLLVFRHVGRVGCGDVRSSHGLPAMGLRKPRVRQADPRLEEGRRGGSVGAVDTGHGGPAFAGAASRGVGGGRAVRGGVACSILG
jgi:hypothetical protein